MMLSPSLTLLGLSLKLMRSCKLTHKDCISNWFRRMYIRQINMLVLMILDRSDISIVRPKVIDTNPPRQQAKP
jgi:hypothetical protein